MSIVHFRNLTNGLNCDCPPWSVYKARVIRLQSTACEQHRWDAILKELGADLYYCLAVGESCVVHDKSERDRETRACWQGLSWVRYACHRAWRKSKPPMEFSLNAMPLNPYWEQQFCQLTRSTRNMLRYYRKFDRGGLLDIYSCYTPSAIKRVTNVETTKKLVQEAGSANEGRHPEDHDATEFPTRSLIAGLIALPFEG